MLESCVREAKEEAAVMSKQLRDARLATVLAGDERTATLRGRVSALYAHENQKKKRNNKRKWGRGFRIRYRVKEG
jgi:hypothetical protein